MFKTTRRSNLSFLTREKELRSNLPKYEPEIIHKDNATIQSFTASEIHFENTEDEDGESLLEVFLSDLADDGQTNIHCLILNIQDSETVYSEWNDQRNARWSEHIKNVELINDCLSLSFKEGREVLCWFSVNWTIKFSLLVDFHQQFTLTLRPDFARTLQA